MAGMAVFLWVLGLSLLMQSCLCSIGEVSRGCMKWTSKGEDVCCEACHPGHRLFKECGRDPKELCTLCEPGRYTLDPKNRSCKRCTQCTGNQVYVKLCTATSDTVCGCKEGLTCADDRCSYCKACGKGEEPTDRGCKPCPDGTFNDQIHQKCKPWSAKCSNPEEEKVAKGNATSDIKCSFTPLTSPTKIEEPAEQKWPLYLSIVITMLLTGIILIVVSISISIVAKKTLKKKMEGETNTDTKIPIISTPTDDPRTLIAIECSFHDAQQEQGSSSESLASKESSARLVA